MIIIGCIITRNCYKINYIRNEQLITVQYRILFVLFSRYFFPCQRWLATDQDDGQIARELVAVDKHLRDKLGRKDSTAIRDEIALETKGMTLVMSDVVVLRDLVVTSDLS